MKTFPVAIVSAMLSVAAGVAAEPTVRITGIAQVSGGLVALLEIQPARGPLFRPTLRQGERVEGVEVISIDAKAAKVSARVGGQTAELPLDAGDATGSAPVFRLKEAHPRQVIELYQELSGRTVITSPSLPVTTITAMSEEGLDAAAAAQALARALGEKGIAVDARFGKFAFATAPLFAAKVAKLKAPPEVPKPGTRTLAPGEELYPAGLIKFAEADTMQVLDILQELMGRTLISSPNLPTARHTLKSQTPLGRAEAIWLLEASLELSDVAVTLSGDKFAFVTTTIDAPRAAKFRTPPPPSEKSNDEAFPPGLIKFNEADRAQVLDMYQAIFGQSLLRAPDLPPSKITLKSQTPLTRDEAAWLIESALYLRGIRFVPDGDKQVKVLPETSLNAANN